MKCYFDTESRRQIVEANINYYGTPFVHPHRTMDEHDFIYLIDGEWKLGQNKEVYTLKKDSLLILSARTPHFGISPCSSGTKTMYFHVECVDGDVFKEQNDDKDVIENFIDVSANYNIKKIFQQIVNAKLSGSERKANVLFNLLILELDELRGVTYEEQLGEKIKNLIHQSPEKFWGNKEIADKLGVSVKTAENKFKSLFGTTIHQYILHFKIEQAISYFKNFPEMQMKEIAYNLGFYDEYHFSKQFKKITGLSPSEYKKEVCY